MFEYVSYLFIFYIHINVFSQVVSYSALDINFCYQWGPTKSSLFVEIQNPTMGFWSSNRITEGPALLPLVAFSFSCFRNFLKLTSSIFKGILKRAVFITSTKK